jgi:hypothetical protein
MITIVTNRTVEPEDAIKNIIRKSKRSQGLLLLRPNFLGRRVNPTSDRGIPQGNKIRCIKLLSSLQFRMYV